MQLDGQCANRGTRQPEVDVVRAIYAAFARRDGEVALEHLAYDAEFVPAGAASLVGRSDPCSTSRRRRRSRLICASGAADQTATAAPDCSGRSASRQSSLPSAYLRTFS